jgi:hypothetical protein
LEVLGLEEGAFGPNYRLKLFHDAFAPQISHSCVRA